MSEEQKKREDEVFDQVLSTDDLDAAAGGSFWDSSDDDKQNCVQQSNRNIYGGNGFPNCAATVEEGSYCGTNDGCYEFAVNYRGMTSGCDTAWR